jgi:hypothetical protein
MICISWLVLISCASTSEVTQNGTKHTSAANTVVVTKTEGGQAKEQNISTDGNKPLTSPDEKTILNKMDEYLSNGEDKIFQGSISEGISQLVAVLAEKESLTSPSDKAAELALRAEKELTKLGAALALEADTVWLDTSMNQKTGSTVDITLQPSLILTINQPTGRSLVSNAPIDFQFVKGTGIISGLVNTNSYGQASCNIVRFQNTAQETIIRASLVFRVKAYTYKFKGVERDFVYLPPAKKATVLVLEKSPQGVASDPFILNPVYQRLAQINYDFNLYNGIMAPLEFSLVYEGNLKSIQKMGLEAGVSYLVIVYNECYSTRQMEMNGKKYDIYLADARATVRFIRVSDGKIMYQASVERAKAKNNTHGQGGTEQKAIQDVLRKIADDMALKVEEELPKIKEVLGS